MRPDRLTTGLHNRVSISDPGCPPLSNSDVTSGRQNCFNRSGLGNRMRREGKLPGQDSNLDKENQNLLCYRYTTG